MIRISAVALWDLVIAVLHFTVRGNSLHKSCENPAKSRTKQKRLTSNEHTIEKIDIVPPNAKQSHHTALMFMFLDNDALIKMSIKGRSLDNETRFPHSQCCT